MRKHSKQITDICNEWKLDFESVGLTKYAQAFSSISQSIENNTPLEPVALELAHQTAAEKLRHEPAIIFEPIEHQQAQSEIISEAIELLKFLIAGGFVNQKLPLFQLGTIGATPDIVEMIENGKLEKASIQDWLVKHRCGYFGDLDKEDAASNFNSLLTGDRILSKFKAGCGSKVWIITNAATSVNHDEIHTTVLTPSEY